jgi:hypothetical protein
MKFERITVDPNVCTGKPCIRGLRFPVSRLLRLLAPGETKESILKAYPLIWRIKTFRIQPQEDTSSRATALVLGPNSPTTRATPIIAPAMNTKTARTPRSRSTPMMRLEKTTLKRLQQ